MQGPTTEPAGRPVPRRAVTAQRGAATHKGNWGTQKSPDQGSLRGKQPMLEGSGGSGGMEWGEAF